MTKQPSHSGERPVADPAPDSAETPFDPSHFGRHEFPAGLREELIKAEKPRIDPKFLQDTVPPNRKPVVTEPEPVVTTPRGGFVAPKTQGAVDRDAPTPIAAPATKSVENITDRDATTLIKLPTAKARPQAASTKAADSPSAPPVDTSRTDPTINLAGVRKKNDKRLLVIGVVAALLVLLIVGLLTPSSGDRAQIAATPGLKPAAPQDTTGASPPASPAAAAPTAAADSMNPAQPALSPPDATTRPTAADSSQAKKKAALSSKPLPGAKPAPTGAKTRPGFDPGKPWEED
jgi:hypothetical protein